MRVGTVSLDYYTQNTVAACQKAGTTARKKKLDFAGFTEVRSTKMIEGLENGLGANYNLKGDHKESPIAFKKKKWKCIDFHVKKATQGEAGITPTLYLVICVFQHRLNPNKVVEVIATHLVPLTLHGQKRENYAHRMSMWRNHWELLKEVVADGLAMGHTIFIIGDFNNNGAAKNIIHQIHPKAKWFIRKGLDWIFYVEGNVKIKKSPITHNFNSGSDHKAHWRSAVFI